MALLLSFWLANSACFDNSQTLCANTLKKEVTSPDKILKAVIFEKSCETTTNTQISILPVNSNLPDHETGNVFIYKTEYRETENADGKRANVEVKWLDEKQIIVSFDDFATTKVARMQQSVENVKIIYDKRQATSN